MCGMPVAASYLKTHMARSHGICAPQIRVVDEVGVLPTTYVVSFLKVILEAICPLPGCPEVTHSIGRLCKHFMFHHFRSKLAVLQEGKELLPCCELWGIHIRTGRLIRHMETARYNRNTQMRWRRWDVTITDKWLEATFSLTRGDEATCIEGVEMFNYLGRLLNQSDEYLPEVLHNIRKARYVWGQLGKLLLREGEDPTVSEKLYCTVVQAKLLCGAGTMVIT